MEENYPQYIAKIKIVEQRWRGWSPEGANIPAKENVVEKKSGAFLLIEHDEHKMAGLWDEKDQEAGNMQRVDYKQKEGYRLFISWKLPDKVNFTPEFRMEPLNGHEFPVQKYLPLVEKSLRVGETFEIKPDTRDAGVTYTVTLLEITKQD